MNVYTTILTNTPQRSLSNTARFRCDDGGSEDWRYRGIPAVKLDWAEPFRCPIPRGIGTEMACHEPELGWATTSMVPDAKRHCAAVMAANLVLALCRPTPEPRSVAEAAFRTIGSGPIVRGGYWASRVAAVYGVRTRRRVLFSIRAVTDCLREGLQSAILVQLSRSGELHWILGTGISCVRGVFDLCVADGWHSGTRLFRNGEGARFLAASVFET